MSQFSFLKAEFTPVYEHAQRAEVLALSDPRGSCFYTRLALETAVKWLYQHDGTLRTPYDDALSALIHEGSFRTLVGNALVTKAKLIKDFGNSAVHDSRAVSENTATVALRELFHFSYWLAHTYAKGAKPQPGFQFSAEALPKTQLVEAKTLAGLQAIADGFEKQTKAQEAAEAARIQTQQERDTLDAEIKRLRLEVAATKKANQAIPDDHDYNEAQTRDVFIDLLLREAGWPLDQVRDREFPVTGMPNNTGEGFVDYVLWGADGRPLAIIETKRTKRDARVGRQQAKLYADCLEAMYGRRPIIFYTNGYEHWIWDDAGHPPRPIQGFLKQAELELLILRRTSRKSLGTVAIDEAIAGRFYQTRAIRRIDEAFELDNLRKALLVMATGGGKTRTVIALIDQLMRAGWAKRALFLADRVALVNQAVAAFKAHLPHVAPVNLVTEKGGRLGPEQVAVQYRHRRQGAGACHDPRAQGRERGPAGKDDHLCQEPRPCGLHQRALRCQLAASQGALRAGHRPPDRVCPVADRRLLDQGQGPPYRHLGGHAGHGYRRARGSEPGLLQDRPLEDEVLADDGAGNAAVSGPLRPGAA
jgi:type I restriction enzyme R subunit